MTDEDRKLSDPTMWPVHVYYFGRAVDRLPGPLRSIGSRLYGMARLGLDLTLGTVLHRETEIGEGLLLVHPHNIKIHPEAVLGKRVRINHDVTIGMNPGSTGYPRIGNDVLIGAGAKILGAVTIGDGAVIAANSLVVSDIPAGQVAMGVPARPLPQKKSNVASISGARSRRSQPPPRNSQPPAHTSQPPPARNSQPPPASGASK